MPFDGLTLKKIMEHLEGFKNTTLRQIYQPTRNEYYFQFDENLLRVSLKPTFSFVALSQKFWDKLPYPSSFTMLLRNQLKNARVTNIFQLNLDRVLVIDFKKLRESGEMRNYRLVVELMGKFSNMILVDLNDLKIVDAHRRIDTKFRSIRPGSKFEFYTNDQKNPFEISSKDISLNGNIKRNLLKKLQGFSPLLIDEVIHRVKSRFKENVDYSELFCEAIKQVASEVVYEKGMYLYSDEDIFEVVGIKLQVFKGKKFRYFKNPFEALEEFSRLSQEREIFISKLNNLVNVVVNKKKRVDKTLKILKKQVKEYENYEIYKKFGELLLSNLHNLKIENERYIQVHDWETNEDIKLEIEPTESFTENARRFFEKYKKYKGKLKGAKKRLESLKEELRYLEQLDYHLSTAENLEDLEEIEREMVSEGLIKVKKKHKEKTNGVKYKVYEYEGFKILVGKNNQQNDELTLRVAKRDDLWFHVQGIPGSHVILKIDSGEPDERVVEYAATLAAKHSKAYQSSKVAVDYTKVKNVWKPRGAKPGFVHYKNFKTIVVNPSKLA